MSKIVDKYFIACVELREIKGFDGVILVEDGITGWLGESEGYATITRLKDEARHFKKTITLADAIPYNGKPWYYQAKQGSLRVFEVVETVEKSRKETELL